MIGEINIVNCANFQLDPLNWSFMYKLFVLFQAAFLAFLGPFTQAVINSAFAPLSKAEHISLTTASYVTTVPILFAGIFPLFWSPISNVYGRRTIFMAVGVLGIVGHCATGAATSWGGILTARVFMGIGTSAGMGIGAAVVAGKSIEESHRLHHSDATANLYRYVLHARAWKVSIRP